MNEINNSGPRDLNLLFTNKTSGREEASWWETFESQDVASIMSLIWHTLSHWLWEHTLSHCLWGHTLSHCLWGHTLTLRTNTVSLTLRTHTDSEDTHCLTVSEDTHCGGNLSHHYSIKTHGPISRKLTESIWWFGDRMSLERLRCSGWVSGWDQLNQPDGDLNFPDPSL